MMKFVHAASLAGIFSAGTLLAQDAPPPPDPAVRPVDPPTRRIIPNRDIRPDRRPDEKLTEITVEQRAKVEDINAAFRKATEPLELRLRAARGRLEQLVNGERPEEGSIRSAAREIGEIEGDLALARSQRMSKLREFLSPDQLRRFTFISPNFDRRSFPVPHPTPPPAKIPGRVPAE